MELDKALVSDSENTKPLPAPLLPLLCPFLDLASRTNSSVTYQRVFNEIFHPLFAALKPPSVENPELRIKKRPRLDDEPGFEHVTENSCLEDPKKEGKAEKVQLRKALLRKMFDVASGPDARESNRRKMHAVWKAAMAEEDDIEADEQDQGSS